MQQILALQTYKLLGMAFKVPQYFRINFIQCTNWDKYLMLPHYFKICQKEKVNTNI